MIHAGIHDVVLICRMAKSENVPEFVQVQMDDPVRLHFALLKDEPSAKDRNACNNLARGEKHDGWHAESDDPSSHEGDLLRGLECDVDMSIGLGRPVGTTQTIRTGVKHQVLPTGEAHEDPGSG